jgi:hypothetical protein
VAWVALLAVIFSIWNAIYDRRGAAAAARVMRDPPHSAEQSR